VDGAEAIDGGGMGLSAEARRRQASSCQVISCKRGSWCMRGCLRVWRLIPTRELAGGDQVSGGQPSSVLTQ